MCVDDLWGFCLKLYAEPGIEDLCLDLQDQQQVNVLILLWCTWLELRRENLTDDILHDGYECVRRVNDPVLVPLRQARRFIKTESSLSVEAAERVRGHILAAELAIEQSLLRKLESLPTADPVTSLSDSAGEPLDRLVLYLGLHPADWVATLRAAADNVYPCD